MIISLVGNNSFALRQRLDELVGTFIKDHGELAVQRIDAQDSEPQTIIDAVQNVDLLSPRKMVVVRGLGSHAQALETLEQIIGSITDSTDLVLYEPITDKRNVYYKNLKLKTQLEEFSDLDTKALAGWLAEQAKAQGGQLSLADANYLIERVGTNQAMLKNELDKLILYDISVLRKTIDKLVEPTPQSKIF